MKAFSLEEEKENVGRLQENSIFNIKGSFTSSEFKKCLSHMLLNHVHSIAAVTADAAFMAQIQTFFM